MKQAGAVQARDPQLVHAALDALFEIAWSESSPGMASAIHEQLEQLDPAMRDDLLTDMVDTDLLANLLSQVATGHMPDALEPLDADLDPRQAELVAAALTPLAALTGAGPGDDAVAAMAPETRARVLFAAVNRFGGLG